MCLDLNRAGQIIEQNKGDLNTKAMTFVVSRPNELLATILVGNNIVNILASSLTTVMATRIMQNNAVGAATGIVTIIILIFGEAIPKSFARTHADKLSVTIILILRFLYYSLYPIIRFLVWIIHTVLGDNARPSGRSLTRGDLEYMINRAEREKTIDPKQLDLLSSILQYPRIKVKDVMVSRLEIKWLNSNATFDEVMDRVRDKICGRYPVCEGTLDKTVGILHVKDLVLVRGALKQDFQLKKLLKPPFFIYEHMKIPAVFDYMNRKKTHMALVKDESGLVVGLVTLEDIIEEVMGEIHDEHDHHVPAEDVMENRKGIVLEGGTTLRELYNEYDIEIPLNDNYSTISGFVLDMMGNNFPEEGQIIAWKGLIFEVCKIKDSNIESVRIRDANGEKIIVEQEEHPPSAVRVEKKES